MRSGVLMGGIVCGVGVAMAAVGPAPGETQAQPPRGLSSQLPEDLGQAGPTARPLRDAPAAPEARGTTGAEDVPSPGTVALLAVGGLVVMRRQRR